jgi:hypothetical protein
VEEFMLLANRRVAKFIADAFPQRAVLRRHPPPDARKLDGLRKFCEQHGLELDLSSAGALHASLQVVRDAALAAGDKGLAEVVTLQVRRCVCACVEQGRVRVREKEREEECVCVCERGCMKRVSTTHGKWECCLHFTGSLNTQVFPLSWTLDGGGE